MGQIMPIDTHNILLVEDEAIIRFLQIFGCWLRGASDADEAIAILER